MASKKKLRKRIKRLELENEKQRREILGWHRHYLEELITNWEGPKQTIEVQLPLDYWNLKSSPSKDNDVWWEGTD